MTVTAQQVLKDALVLSPIDRAELIERLSQSFDSSGDQSVDAAWVGEVESRFAAYDAGKIEASALRKPLA